MKHADQSMSNIHFTLPERYNASAVLFHNLAAGRADKIAIYCGEQTVTYSQLCERANRAGNALKNLQIEAGARIMQLMLDTPDFPALFFGALKAGYVPIVTNTALTPDDYAYFLQDSAAQVAILDAALYSQIASIRAQCPDLRHVIVVGDAPPDTINWETWLRDADSELEAADTHKDDPAFWMYSSGSTGRPKGIVHLHHDIPYTIATYAKHVLEIGENDVTFSVPKLFFAYGFGNNMTFPFSVGASTILWPGRPTPDVVFDHIERYRPTLFFAVPTIYVPMLALAGGERRDLSSLRMCISAAEALPPDVYHQWLQRYQVEIIEGLGSTEVLHIYISNYPNRVKAGSSGTLVAGYEIELRDPDGNLVPLGETGAMLVRGDSSAPYYWNRPDKTAHTMRGDWIYTGDLFKQDADGYFHFNGRADEMMKVSGQWVSPVEVELTLSKHAAVKECAVIPTYDAAGLMTSKAYVVLHEPADASPTLAKALQDFVKQQIAPYKYPRIIKFLAELPKTGTDKIDRMALRALEKESST